MLGGGRADEEALLLKEKKENIRAQKEALLTEKENIRAEEEALLTEKEENIRAEEENNVINAADSTYTILKKRGDNYMTEWLEKKLPLLLDPIYVPMADPKKIIDRLDKQTGLKEYWKTNALFIKADLDRELREIFPLVHTEFGICQALDGG